MRKHIILIFLIILKSPLFGQEIKRYWIYVNEPVLEQLGVSPSSTPSLSPLAMERRLRQDIPLRLWDYSFSNQLIDLVESTGANVRFFSRWLRALSVEASSDELAIISSLEWVSEIKPVLTMGRKEYDAKKTYGFSYGQGLGQVEQINLDPVHDAGYAGQDILIALMDGGFSGTETHSVFQGAWSQGRIVLTKDFVDGDTNVFHVGSHGMSVLSTICADLNGTFVGTAPEASYALFRTENELSETLAEEDNWVWASEWADSIGVDVINTSLGYTTFDNGVGDHSYADLNGKTSVISIAATIAARVGMIVVVAAGNEGASSWKYISCPADADSILSIGSVDALGIRSGFSSQGPTSDGRIKPDVMARGSGATVMTSNGTIGTSSGTSFASPIICGATASILQAVKANNSVYNIQDILTNIRNSSSNSFNPDSLKGYGIPNYGSLLNSIGLIDNEVKNSWSLFYSGEGWVLTNESSFFEGSVQVLDSFGRVLFQQSCIDGCDRVLVPKFPFLTYVRLDSGSKEIIKIPPHSL